MSDDASLFRLHYRLAASKIRNDGCYREDSDSQHLRHVSESRHIELRELFRALTIGRQRD